MSERVVTLQLVSLGNDQLDLAPEGISRIEEVFHERLFQFCWVITKTGGRYAVREPRHRIEALRNQASEENAPRWTEDKIERAKSTLERSKKESEWVRDYWALYCQAKDLADELLAELMRERRMNGRGHGAEQ